MQWASMTDEAEGIADFIKARVVAERVSPGKTLVLAPTRQFGYAIRDKLNASGVDAHSFFHEEALHGDPKDIDDCKAQEAFTLLTLLPIPMIVSRSAPGVASGAATSAAGNGAVYGLIAPPRVRFRAPPWTGLSGRS